jgi:hypothetical protein
MNRTEQLQALEEENSNMARGGMQHKDEKRTRVVRLRESTYNELRKIGEMGNDVDDIVSILLEFWWRHHRAVGERR